MSTVLVVDGDRNVLKLVQRALADSNITVLTSTTVVEGLALLEQHGADLLIIDIKLPGLTCPETPDRIRQIDPKVPVTYITVSGASDLAIRAMQLGAFDFLLKPLDAAQVREVVQRAMAARRLTKKPIIVQEASDERGDEGSSGDVLIGRSGPMLDVYKEIGRAAGQDATVLICGESGTGKELVARAVFQHSSRKDRPFLAVNCAALTTTLLESELFGHEKGAFTGADKGRIGKFEQCHGGTIFLDEVGDMSQELQCKMLRLVQEQKFERVGGAKTIQTDVRIIAATNHDLEQMVDEGEFRLDLYHRLN
ncbi:MAG: sigma-54 dependent transcriptional regulator, partial [Planctomycetales bacterium]